MHINHLCYQHRHQYVSEIMQVNTKCISTGNEDNFDLVLKFSDFAGQLASLQPNNDPMEE